MTTRVPGGLRPPRRGSAAALAALVTLGGVLAAPVAASAATTAQVKEAQDSLNGLGYNAGAVDGVAGAQTQTATRSFQDDRCLAVDGAIGPNTLSALESQVRAVQTKVSVATTGLYDAATESAVTGYQSAHGLNANGIAAATTMSSMGVERLDLTCTYHAWTWNVAGWAIHHGSVSDGLITALADSIRNRSSDFAALNELCWSQYRAVQSNLRNSGWPQDVDNFSRFAQHNSGGCGGEPFGVAIFSRVPLGTVDDFALAADGTTETRQLLCAPTISRHHLRFCTTHITPSNDVINGQKINETQLGQVLGHLESYNSAGDTVIVAGDFNAQPSYGRLDGYYSASVNTANNGNNHGAYRELDDTDPVCPGYGEDTQSTDSGPCGTGKKIDLIFVRENRIDGTYDADSLALSTSCGGACSDHQIVIGTVPVAIAP